MAEGAMADFLTNIGTAISQFVTWITTILSTVVSTPVLVVPIAIFVAGAMIGLARRLLRVS